MKISSVAQMRQMDRMAIEEDQIPELLLMENAGLAATEVLVRHYLPQLTSRRQRWLVLCGVGNNGGDGLVVARQLHSRGVAVNIILLGDPARFGEAAARNLAMVKALQLPLVQPTSVAPVVALLDACDGVVDGLLGTGISRAVTGLFAEVIEATNRSGKPVVSLDIASGVNGDTGQAMGVAIQAQHTITFGLPKAGNLLYPGYAQGGQLWVTHIGFAPRLYAGAALQVATNDPVTLPPRAVAGHKGTFGDTLIVAGAGTYYGAPYFSALACMKAGGGYVRLATPASVAPVIAARVGELVFLPQAETVEHTLAASNQPRLSEMAAKLDFVVIGPGTSLHDETQALLRALIAEIEQPVLIDGDGITAVSRNLDVVRQRRGPTVLTPHTGEFARISGLEVATIEADRVGALQKVCADLGAVIVLKGAHSLIGYPDGRVYINLSGNSGLATAGSGDVLTGTIAAMAGLGLAFDEAVRMGVFVHGVAGDLAAARVGEDGMTAQDVLEALPHAVAACRAGEVGMYFLQEV